MSLSVKDLGVLFDFKLLFSDHCNSFVNKAYIPANMFIRCFHSRDSILQMKLFNTFVCPILEYNSPVCLHILTKILEPLNVGKNFSPKGYKNWKMCLIRTD